MHFKSWLPELWSPSAHFSLFRLVCMWTMGICGDFRTSEALCWEVYFVFEQRVSLCPVLLFYFYALLLLFVLQFSATICSFFFQNDWEDETTTYLCDASDKHSRVPRALKGRAQRLDWDLIKKERRLTEGIKLCTWLCFMSFLCYYMFLSATEATPLFSVPYWNMLYERVATKALLLHQLWIMSLKS